MNEHRREILEMLSTGKITADEAERLLAALDKGQALGAAAASSEAGARSQPKYLHVLVESEKRGGPAKLNVRVPIQLLRAGVRLASLIPAQARDQVKDAIGGKDTIFDLSQITPENLEEFVGQLNDLTLDVDRGNKKVRFSCE
jgi:hypothetical protein